MIRKSPQWVGLALVALFVGLLTGCSGIKRSLYAPADRDEWQHPARVIESLRLESGAQVADIGAGGGYFTFRLADAAGESGWIWAIDVDEGMTSYLSERAEEEGYGNIRVVLAKPDDPGLPAGLDLVFTCNTYHHLEGRQAYFAAIKPHLAPGGRVAIIEFKAVGWFQRIFGHNTPAGTIKSEMQAAGFVLVAEHDFLERQSFLVFRPAG